MATEKNTTRVTFVEISSDKDNLTRVYFHKISRRPDGGEKLFNGAAIVKNKRLQKRLEQLETGIEIEIETEKGLEGKRAAMFLVNFEKLEPFPQSEQTVLQNGNLQTQNGEMVAEPELELTS